MRIFAKLVFLCTATASLAFTGCQHVIQTPSSATQQLEPSADASKNFNLQGKIGIKTPKQSGSAFYTWQQNQNDFDIQLTGILGIGKTIIEGKSGQVTLNSSKTGEITAATPEELLERATGWNAPITYIIDWVQAKAATEHAKTQTDDQQRITQINESGWMVQLSYHNDETLPNKLILKQQLENGEENRITMVIQNRSSI